MNLHTIDAALLHWLKFSGLSFVWFGTLFPAFSVGKDILVLALAPGW
jgi:hypothetical protein